MDYTGSIGDPKSLKIFGEFFDFVTPNATMAIEECGGRLQIVDAHFKPGFRLAQTVSFVKPKVFAAEFENDGRCVIAESRKTQDIGIKPNCRVQLRYVTHRKFF